MKLLSRIRVHFVGRVATLVLAIAFSAIVSVALLPLATRILHADDYGTYALFMSIVALVSTAMDGGASLILPARYGPALASERGRLFVSLAAISGIGATAIALLLTAVWKWQHSEITSQIVPFATIGIVAAIIPMRAITSISVMVFSVTGRSDAIAAQMVSQAILVFIGTLVALFGFSMGGVSLFIGAACGQFAALCVSLFVHWRHDELSAPSRQWFRGAMSSAPTSGASGLMDGARGFGENAILVSTGGLYAAGILSQARLYYNLLMAFGSAVGHNVRVKSLDDARDPRSNFKTTHSAWEPVQIVFSCAGIFFVFFGKDVVNIITNGKLVEAASYLPALAILALIQITEQPAAAIVFASGRAGSATWFRTIFVFIIFVGLPPLIVFFGIKGILAVGIVEAFAYRRYLHFLASRERHVPFQDGVAVLGCLAIIAAQVYMELEIPPLGVELILTAAGILVIAFAGRRSIGDILAEARQVIALWRTPQ